MIVGIVTLIVAFFIGFLIGFLALKSKSEPTKPVVPDKKLSFQERQEQIKKHHMDFTTAVSEDELKSTLK